MSELRQNLITRDWVIIATERATRPDQFANTKMLPAVVPPHRADCRFCVGNEEDGTLETCRLGDRAGWKIRATRAIASDVMVTVESCARSVEPFVKELAVVQSAKVRSHLVLKESSLGGWVEKISLTTI
ncbi:hypothetical protein [Microcoleus sp. S13_C5]|uniref:hypothetical protein n=1 Tax=Microcoleus sp. S13_C5 TaxID=3055411 RepID=UPI002FD715E7